jgi:hypothetical protein
MKKLRFLFTVYWRTALVYLLVFLALGALLFVRLESLAPSYAGIESSTFHHLQNRDLGLKTILEKPLYMPYNLGIYALEKLHLQGVYMARAISAAVGFVAVLSFFFIVRRWHDMRISLFATILFATSSWFLHVARLADAQASILLILPLIACAAWLNDTKRRGVMPLALAGLTGGLLLYIPGLLWFVLLGLFWQRRRLRRTFRSMMRSEILVVVLGTLLIILPGILAVVAQPLFLLELLGLPSKFIGAGQVLDNSMTVIREILLHGPDNTAYWIGSMPLLDAFTGAMFIIGLYSYRLRLRLDRAKLLLLFRR